MKILRVFLLLIALASNVYAASSVGNSGVTGQDDDITVGSSSILNCTGAGIVCSFSNGKIVFNVGAGAGGLTDPAANGILSRTALDTTVARTITGTANQITVTNGNGVAGNPVLSFPNNMTLPGTTTGTFFGNLAGNADTSTALTANPSPCGANNFVTDTAANGTLTCNQPAFSNLSGTASDAQIPDLNALSTGLTAGRCVETNGSSVLVVAAGACGTSTGAPTSSTYITQTPDGTLSAEQALSLLATGLLKSTTSTGILSIATAGVDYAVPGSDSCSSTTGSDTYACSPSPSIGAYANNAHYRFIPTDVGNTGAASINLNSLGAKTIKKMANGTAVDLSTGDIGVRQPVDVVYVSTDDIMVMVSSIGTVTDAQIPNLNALSTGLTALRCIETDASSILVVAASACGGAGSGDIDSVTAGTGLSGGGTSGAVTLNTDSSEQGFLSSGALTCGASTNGKALVHTTPLQYCDNSGTPTLRYSAYGNSTGESTTAANDSVALTTDTTGNYVQSVATGKGLTGGTAGSEGATLSLGIGTLQKCLVVKGATAADDYPFEKFPYAITITDIHVYAIGGTNVVGGLDECTGTNGVCSSVTAVDSDITGTVGSNVEDDGTLTNGGIAANNWIQWHTTSVSGTNTSLSVCFNYTID